MTQRLVCVPVAEVCSDMAPGSDDTQDSSSGSSTDRGGDGGAGRRRPRPRRRGPAKQRTNALINIIYGFTTVHYTYGRTERRKGGIKKHRLSFNPLSMTCVQGGEGYDSYLTAVKATQQYADDHHPFVAERLRQVSGACSDFTSGCQAAYRDAHGASHSDAYADDEGVLVAKAPCLLKGCVDHALPNLLYLGKTGWNKRKEHPGLTKQQAPSRACPCLANTCENSIVERCN